MSWWQWVAVVVCFGVAALGWGCAAAGTAASVTGEAPVLSALGAGRAPGIVPPFEAIQAANFSEETTSTAIGMKA